MLYTILERVCCVYFGTRAAAAAVSGEQLEPLAGLGLPERLLDGLVEVQLPVFPVKKHHALRVFDVYVFVL